MIFRSKMLQRGRVKIIIKPSMVEKRTPLVVMNDFRVESFTYDYLFAMKDHVQKGEKKAFWTPLVVSKMLFLF